MKKHFIFLTMFVWVLPPLCAQSYTVELYPQNEAYLVVCVSTTGLAAGEYLRDVLVKVQFVDQDNNVLGKMRLEVTDQQRWILESGETYRRYFLHGRDPEGLRFTMVGRAVKAAPIGDKGDMSGGYGTMFILAHMPDLIEESATVIGEIPSLKRSTGM